MSQAVIEAPQATVEKNWDYTHQAEFYKFRPNYSPKAIDTLVYYVAARPDDPTYHVLDVGAGTGNLTVMLLDHGLRVTAAEPNDAMRQIGIAATQGRRVEWVKADGLHTRVADGSVDWVTFGSSFNVLDRALALKETHRALKPGGYFSCMWNHRDLDDPVQRQCERIIQDLVPGYERGVRREDQNAVIAQSGLFTDNCYLEVDFQFDQSRENYIGAWKSVRNKFWDIGADDGIRLFNKIEAALRTELPEVLHLRYTTRIWTARAL